MKRFLNISLLAILLALQSKWWLGQGGLREQWRLQKALAMQIEENQSLQARNQVLVAEVRDLKTGTDALEERARNEFGLVQADESFYQVVQRTIH